MKRAAAIVFPVVILICIFIFGNITYKYGIHRMVPGTQYVLGILKRPCSTVLLKPAPQLGPSEILSRKDVSYPFKFIVYGDSQEIAGYEKDSLIAQIIKENPSFVLHTGDMVTLADEHQWKIFDHFDGNILNNGIPMYPVLGNHEYKQKDNTYSGNCKETLSYYYKRFKYIKDRRWYSFIFGNSRFLMLDTNTDYSTGSEQHSWFINELRKKNNGFLFVTFHHPPYTKGLEYSHTTCDILSKTMESYEKNSLSKVDIVFSGHVHNYERYAKNNINYIVTGGGGNIYQQPIQRDKDDFFTITDSNYHYCKVTVYRDKAIFEMIRLNKESNSWKVADTFIIERAVSH